MRTQLVLPGWVERELRSNFARAPRAGRRAASIEPRAADVEYRALSTPYDRAHERGSSHIAGKAQPQPQESRGPRRPSNARVYGLSDASEKLYQRRVAP